MNEKEFRRKLKGKNKNLVIYYRMYKMHMFDRKEKGS